MADHLKEARHRVVKSVQNQIIELLYVDNEIQNQVYEIIIYHKTAGFFVFIFESVVKKQLYIL